MDWVILRRDKTKLIESLFQRLPSFREHRATEDNTLPYVVFGSLADFLLQKATQPSTAQVLREAFGFLTELAESDDAEFADLAIVGVFEPLTDSEQGIALARTYLSGAAADYFERTLKGWGRRDA